MSIPLVSRREYKVMLDHRLFLDRKAAAESFCRELHAVAKRLKKIECDGEFKTMERREITFLDTSDETIRLNRLVFRKRADLEKNETEYTLKCRSPDRYVAAGANVEAASGLKGKPKFEEDIGAPFVSRFSHSTTIKGPAKAPSKLKDAAVLFSALGKLKRDGERSADSLELHPVNRMTAFERVLSGPLLRFDDTEAEVALILWSDGSEGRPLVAEFSLRYRHDEEDFSAKAARRAMRFFEEVQRLDWCVPEGKTKTQFAYRE
jgi:hypothetical protein